MEFESTLTNQEENHIRIIKYRWNDLNFLKGYINQQLGLKPTSLMEAWELLFPSLYPSIKEEYEKLNFERIDIFKYYKDSVHFFPRSSGYNTINNFCNVIKKIKIYGAQVDVFYDIFNIDEMYEEQIRKKEKKELYRIYIKKKLDRDVYLYIDEFI
jgi:hypothetical protein